MKAVRKSSKLQDPSSREAPNFKPQPARAYLLELGAWSFSGAWTLELGALAVIFVLGALAASAQPLIHAKDGSGVFGYKDTPKLPWCEYVVHDPDRPAPKRVEPGPAGPPVAAPADAVILFDGKDLSKWQNAETECRLVDGCIEAVGAGNLITKQSFGSCQIHLEWMAPADFKGPWYNRGNNGVMLMNQFEIQIFDSWNEKLYPDGQAAAVYGQTPPLVNACRKPGEWQTYDIVFTAPLFEGSKLEKPAKVTMFHNSMLVHLDQQIYGETGHRILPEYKQKTSTGPLALANHHCPVRFRNIWLRPL
jgi:hypothetical protein